MSSELYVFTGVFPKNLEPLILDGRTDPESALITLRFLPLPYPVLFLTQDPHIKQQAHLLGAFAVVANMEEAALLHNPAKILCETLKKQEKTEKCLKRAMRKMQCDPLTGALNRREMEAHLQQEWRKPSQSLSLLILDVDHFKRVNDTYGHLQGDYCLKELTALLRKHLLRKTDRLFRYGGEEFVVILPKTDATGAERVGQRILQGVREHRMAAPPWTITISIGVATIKPEDGTTPEDLLRTSYDALQTAKQEGRDRMVIVCL